MGFRLGMGDIKIVNKEGEGTEVGKMIPAQNYNKIMDLLGQLQTELSMTVQQEEKKVEWFDTVDTLTILGKQHKDEKIEIECNYNTWSLAKEDINKYDDVLLLDVFDGVNGENASIALTLKQMKLLRDYLNHKIEYIEN